MLLTLSESYGLVFPKKSDDFIKSSLEIQLHNSFIKVNYHNTNEAKSCSFAASFNHNNGSTDRI